VDPTADLTVQGPFAEDSELAITDTDIYSRGPGEERPAFPGLTLLVDGATSHGAGQGLDPGDPPLGPSTVTESRPQAVDLVHPPSQTGTRGAGHSTHFWDDVEPLMEQEQHSDHSTAINTYAAGLTLAPNWVRSHKDSTEAWDALNLLALTATHTKTTDKTQVQQQTELVANAGEWIAPATIPSTDTTMSVTVLSRVPDADTPLTALQQPMS